MNSTTASDRGPEVRSMFGRIAQRYDLLNRIMTFGQDKRWRKEAIEKLEIKQNSTIIDVGTGTGDLALEIARTHPGVRIIACDFTPQMLSIAKQRETSGQIDWVIADVQNLPFPKNVFDAAISGFLLRNVSDIKRTLEQQFRVLSSGGRFACVDTTPQKSGLFSAATRFYLKRIIPLIGRLLSGSPQDYHYLSTSTIEFLTAEELAESMLKSGFEVLGFERRMFGSTAIHWGKKPNL